MNLRRDDDRIGRSDESVLPNRVNDVSNGDFASEGSTVVDDWFAGVTVPAVDCRGNAKKMEEEDEERVQFEKGRERDERRGREPNSRSTLLHPCNKARM